MSESEHSTAIVPFKESNFKMPNFKGREQHMMAQWETLIKTTNLDIKDHVDKESTKAISNIMHSVTAGSRKVADDQQDLHKINLGIKAFNKKIELERRIRYMATNEGVISRDEMLEKLELLNQNLNLLSAETDEEVEAYSGEEVDGEVHPMKRNHKNRRSVDAIHSLENKLGLPVSNNNDRVMNYKEKLHVPKEQLLKSQESAEQFITKMKQQQKQLISNRNQRQRRQASKTQTIMDSNSHKKKEFKEKQKEKVLERVEEHKQQLNKVKEVRAAREQNYALYKRNEKKTKRLHEKIEDKYNRDILMPELERKKKNLGNFTFFNLLILLI
jgi:hypothetical protein